MVLLTAALCSITSAIFIKEAKKNEEKGIHIMNYQETIKVLTLDEQMQKKLPNLKEVYEVVVKALEKQVPKNPIKIEPCKSFKYYKCPICNEFLRINKNFCEDCGQAIDWSD